MKYLLLYYDLRVKRYVYRVFGDCENALKYRNKIHQAGICRTSYCYQLYGKYGGFI